MPGQREWVRLSASWTSRRRKKEEGSGAVHSLRASPSHGELRPPPRLQVAPPCWWPVGHGPLWIDGRPSRVRPPVEATRGWSVPTSGGSIRVRRGTGELPQSLTHESFSVLIGVHATSGVAGESPGAREMSPAGAHDGLRGVDGLAAEFGMATKPAGGRVRASGRVRATANGSVCPGAFPSRPTTPRTGTHGRSTVSSGDSVRRGTTSPCRTPSGAVAA